jgi:hypothetical protein
MGAGEAQFGVGFSGGDGLGMGMSKGGGNLNSIRHT